MKRIGVFHTQEQLAASRLRLEGAGIPTHVEIQSRPGAFRADLYILLDAQWADAKKAMVDSSHRARVIAPKDMQGGVPGDFGLGRIITWLVVLLGVVIVGLLILVAISGP